MVADLDTTIEEFSVPLESVGDVESIIEEVLMNLESLKDLLFSLAGVVEDSNGDASLYAASDYAKTIREKLHAAFELLHVFLHESAGE